MEKIRGSLHNENCSDSSETFDDSDSCDSLQPKVCPTLANGASLSKVKLNGERRLPTRRPDPNVRNRNALLARENRRKKKAYIETLERELEEARNENRSLAKKLKKQVTKSCRLENEKRYFENLVRNQSDYKKLVSAIRSCLPLQALGPESSDASLISEYYSQPIESEPEAPGGNDFNEAMFAGTSCTGNFLDDIPTEFEPKSPINSSLNSLLEEDDYDQAFRVECNDFVQKSDDLAPSNVDVGVCLHVTHNRVTLEFCPACHFSSATPPQELLQHDFTA